MSNEVVIVVVVVPCIFGPTASSKRVVFLVLIQSVIYATSCMWRQGRTSAAQRLAEDGREKGRRRALAQREAQATVTVVEVVVVFAMELLFRLYYRWVLFIFLCFLLYCISP